MILCVSRQNGNIKTEGSELMNEKAFRDFLKARGIKIGWLCEKTGISRQTLHNKMNGHGQFNVSDINTISQALNLSKSERDIFFMLDG